MPVYERYGDDHEVVERVITVAGSREDQRLADSDQWKPAADEQQATAGAKTTAPQAATTKAAKTTAKG